MTDPKRPLKVFLCHAHAHADRDPVRGLYTRLTQDGVDAWFDKAKLLPGQDWELEIRKAVREADVVVVCLSKLFNQAGFRQKEVRLALDTAMEKPEGEIFIIPARLEECDTLESLRKWHWVDLFEEDGYEMLMRALRTRAEKIGAALQVEKIWLSKATAPQVKVKKEVKPSRKLNTTVIALISAAIIILVAYWQFVWIPNHNSVTSGKITYIGRVVDSTSQEPIVGARVSLDIEGAPSVVYTDSEGVYSVTLTVTTDSFAGNIRVDATGYEIYARNISIGKNNPTIDDIHLTSSQSSDTNIVSDTPTVILNSMPTSLPITPVATVLPTEITDANGMQMVLVPAGDFIMGSDEGYDSKPAHVVYLDSFYMDKYEVSNTFYALCVTDGVCQEPENPNSYSYYDYYHDPK
jgi:hypothetical protein